MIDTSNHERLSDAWPAMASAALRIAFGLVWVVNAALSWTPAFAANYVGYLHNAARGQAAWSGWWFDMWLAVVTPHAGLFVLLTRLAETALAIALLVGFARKTTYLLGALFSLLIWSTAEGFGGPYVVGATNMGGGIGYVLIFVALIVLNYRAGASPYSVDYLLEKRWPAWQRVCGWRADRPAAAHTVSWRVQASALFGIALIAFFLVAGLYSSTHVKPATPVTAAAAVEPLALASSKPIGTARDARLPPLQPGPSVDVHMVATNHKVEIASGVYYQAWTFGNGVPGPFIHVRQGQTVNVTFTNQGTMQHSVDFHAAQTPPNLHFVDINPGETIHFSFVARVPGAFIYHCGTPPVLLHMANGMYGALIVDPAKPLPPADESYVLVQSEWYTRQIAGTLMGPDFDKMKREQPDEVVFNGAAFQYRDHPLFARKGKRVRLYVVNAGPNLWTSFHVIGAIFDKVYPDGDPAHVLSGVSTYPLGPGEGAVFDLVIPHPGEYSFVDHDMAHMALGAHGILEVAAADATRPQGDFSPLPATSATVSPVTSAAPARAASSGPYAFDAKRGAELYAANCVACHQASGKGLPGVFPPLVGNAAVLDEDPGKQVDVILHGLHGEPIDGVAYSAAMPPFGKRLNDAEIADIINHERSSWGNQARHVTADQVAQGRAAASAGAGGR